MGNYYEINVSLNGRHLFATAARSITTKSDLVKVFKIFKEKFPEEEGYCLTMTYWSTEGTIIQDIDERK